MSFFVSLMLVGLATMALSLLASQHVKSRFRRFSQIPGSSGFSGAEVAAEILQRNGIHDVSVHEHQGFLGDHYDPVHKRLVLSPDVYHGTSLAALGVAAHEAGHAIQHKNAYLPLHVRMLAVGITTYANQFVTLIPMLGMGMGLAPRWAFAAMAVSWAVIMLFNLITLPVEFDASSRAKAMLTRLGFVRTEGEAAGVAAVLNAAALTYVAAFATSLAYFLVYLLPLLGGGRSSRD